jgi:hypothetical protein
VSLQPAPTPDSLHGCDTAECMFSLAQQRSEPLPFGLVHDGTVELVVLVDLLQRLQIQVGNGDLWQQLPSMRAPGTWSR